MKFNEFLSARFLSNDAVTKRLPAILYIVLLTILYIFNSFQTQDVFRRILRVEREISQLKVTATATQAERIRVTREVNIAEELAKRDIKISSSIYPPSIIE